MGILVDAFLDVFLRFDVEEALMGAFKGNRVCFISLIEFWWFTDWADIAAAADICGTAYIEGLWGPDGTKYGGAACW